MKVNEEIDALTTLGINPIDFLVPPRMLALVLMIPALTLYVEPAWASSAAPSWGCR